MENIYKNIVEMFYCIKLIILVAVSETYIFSLDGAASFKQACREDLVQLCPRPGDQMLHM